jgi:crossover junction endodeoxyribonuclease RusA
VNLRFIVPGPPVSWSRTATVNGRRLTPKAQREYQRHARTCATVAIAQRAWDPSARFAVVVRITRADRRRCDIDNGAKTILDALNGVVWLDDSQVDRLEVERMPPNKERPHVEVEVRAL